MATIWACEHDPEIDRTGGPLPDAGVGGAAGDDGGIAGSGAAGAAGQAGEGGLDAAPCPFVDPAIVKPALPCEIQDILKAKCQRCHQQPPLNGAPFPLLTWENTQAIYFAKPIHARMLNVVSTGFMPYMGIVLDPPVEPLTADEKAKLISWLEECGPPVESSKCP